MEPLGSLPSLENWRMDISFLIQGIIIGFSIAAPVGTDRRVVHAAHVG